MSLSNNSFPFLGKHGGRIERSFRQYPDGAEYAVQENAWMDERVMLDWVQLVLVPWVENAPDDVRPMLILDSYRCHMVDSVRNAIAAAGVELVIIPGGCTCLCQPVDVGINKPFKNLLQRTWVDYLVANRNNAVNGKIPSPSREQLAAWVIDAAGQLSEETIKNSWSNPGYEYFPGEGPEEPADLGEEEVVDYQFVFENGEDDEYEFIEQDGPVMVFAA